ncbi:MAG: hypothetical protein HY922_17525 [Elusimicrobia bacterium]|nr:hypothetical protein [Elusimicrobiota bacterium]
MNDRSFNRLIEGIEEFKPVWKGRDKQWAFFLKEKRRWIRLHVTEYDGTYYFSGSDFDSFSCPGQSDIGPDLDGRLSVWAREIALWKQAVAHDPIEAQALLFKKIPLRCRRGVIQRRNVRLLIPQWMPIASELSRNETKEILEILRKAPPEPLRSMTLKRFFEYCREAYQANPATFRKLGYRSSLSGKEYYRRYADGRDEGLLELDPESSKAFERWYRCRPQGGHPWEIYRGGNSTHIDMYVSKPALRPEGWEVHLRASSSTRLVETCRIALALTKAGLPVHMDDAESYINRILDQDWVGIVPQEEGIGYAWQSFPQEWGVQDCVHLDWFYEESPKAKAWLNKRLRMAAHWLPEEISAFLKS